MTALAKIESSDLAITSSGPDLPTIFTLAAKLVKATGFLPSHLVNDGQIAAVILAGAELGIPPMAAIRGIKLVKGNVTLDASLQLGVMTRCGVRFRWLEQSDKVARLRLERPGFEPHEQTFTIEDATRAGLTGGDNWKKYPAAMLRARCVSAAGKTYCPDMLSGVYAPDELEHLEEPRPKNGTSRRTLDDVAGTAPSPFEISVKEKPSPAEPSESKRPGATEYDGETGQVLLTFERHMETLEDIVTNTTPDRESFGAWYSVLTTIELTEPQKRAAWKRFKAVCADFEINANDFINKDVQS